MGAEIGASLADGLRAAAVDRGRVGEAARGDHRRAAAGEPFVFLCSADYFRRSVRLATAPNDP
jgi:hypothetical protein